MTHRHLTAAAALAACTALLLTGCGGSDEGAAKDDDKIAGAEKNESESPAPSSSASDAAGRPDIELPKDVKNVFEGWETGDPEKDSVLADVKRDVNALDDAILRGDANSPNIRFYREGEAAVIASDWVQAWLDEDLSFTGTTRYFDPQIEMSDEVSANVVYCADESKAYNKNRKTGKVDKTPAEESPFVLYNTHLEENEQGVWKTTKIVSKRGHESCA